MFKQEIIALSQTDYRLKITTKSARWGINHYYVKFDQWNRPGFANQSDVDQQKPGEIWSMTKAEWKKILPHIDYICKQDFRFKDKKYTFSFEEAFSYKDVLIVYFMPTKEPGTLTLAQLKKELKSAGIPIAAIEQDKQYHRYGSADKYYRLYILKQYKSKLNRYIKSASNYGNIGYEPPRY